MSFSFFLRQLVTNPALLITVLLTLGGHLCQWYHGCAKCHCHLRVNQIAGCESGHCYGSSMQLRRSGCDDHGEFHGCHDHYQYGQFRGRYFNCSGCPVCRAFFHCGLVVLCCFHWMSHQ